jgi:serine/threonine protein kinase
MQWVGYTHPPLRIRIGELSNATALEDCTGGHSEIFLAKWNQKNVIIKHLQQSSKADFENESGLVHRLDHPNIIKLLGIVDQVVGNKLVLALVFEYMRGGDVYNFLNNTPLSPAEQLPIRYNIARQSLQAVAYLHRQHIIHRDIKSENLLLDNHLNIKLADFGYAMQLSQDQSIYYSAHTDGTYGWLAPECLQPLTNIEYILDRLLFRFSKASDVYSCGILLSILLSGDTLPYEHLKTNNEVIWAQNKGVPPNVSGKVSATTQALLTQCWNADLTKRPSVQEIMDHEALKVRA